MVQRITESLSLYGKRLLVRLENLDQGRFPGNGSRETRVSYGPVDGSLVMTKVSANPPLINAALDIPNNGHELVPGTKTSLCHNR